MKKHTAYAVWNGTLKEGNGVLSTQSKVLENTPYTFKTRFGDDAGTNPDELLAAAHAGCFAMALSNVLAGAGFPAETLDVRGEVTMDIEKLSLTGSHLILNAKVPNISQEKFLECANIAKENCPISKAISLPISLEANLI